LTAAQFVDALNANTLDPLNPGTGGSLSQAERDQLVADLVSGAKTRAQVVRAVAEDADFRTREFNRAFVYMQYVGYLRRTPTTRRTQTLPVTTSGWGNSTSSTGTL